MNPRIAILTFLLIPVLISAQVPRDTIEAMKLRVQNATADSSKFAAFMDLSQGYRFSNIDSALYYTNQGLALARAMKNPMNEAFALSLLGYIVLQTGDIPKSLLYQVEALKLSDKFSNPDIEGFALNRIGNVYAEIGDYQKAINYYQAAINLFTKVHEQGFVFNEYSNIGDMMQKIGQLDSAKFYQYKVYEYSLTNTDRYAITYGEVRERLGTLEFRLGNYDKALDHFRSGILEAASDVDLNNLAFIYLRMARLFDTLKQYDSSFYYARNAIATGTEISQKKAVSEAAHLLSVLFKLRGQPDSALRYSEMSASIQDSLYGPAKVNELQRVLLDEQQRQQRIQDERDRQNERYKLGALLATLLVFFVIGIILYRNNYQKKKANKKLQAALDEVKSTQAQLIQSEKMASLGELTAGIAHEIQNPLNFVNNFSELNRELTEELVQAVETGNTGEAITIAKDINENEEKINVHGKRAAAIVKSMLQHSRASSGQRELVDVNSFVDEYLQLAFHGMRAKEKDFNAKIETSFDDQVGKINLVPQDFGRVLLNLVNNAFYGLKKRRITENEHYEPTIRVATKREGTKIEISVQDNGTGIPQTIQDKIFQPFFTTKPTGEGTGLGLSLSYDIVQAHGGTIRVTSKEGEGATFVITLNG